MIILGREIYARGVGSSLKEKLNILDVGGI